MAAPVQRSAAASPLAEAKVILRAAAPVGLTYLIGYASNLISATIVGHLGAQAIGAAALATTWANASGYAVLYGTASALDTLASQAVGAGNLARVAAVRQRGLLVLTALALPIGVAWLCCGRVLLLCGQDPALAAEAQRYIQVLVLGMPAIMAYETYKKTLQAVGDYTPPLVIGLLSALCNAAVGSVLVHSSPLGLLGAAAANALSQWLMLACVLVYATHHRALRAAGAWAFARCARPRPPAAVEPREGAAACAGGATSRSAASTASTAVDVDGGDDGALELGGAVSAGAEGRPFVDAAATAAVVVAASAVRRDTDAALERSALLPAHGRAEEDVEEEEEEEEAGGGSSGAKVVAAAAAAAAGSASSAAAAAASPSPSSTRPVISEMAIDDVLDAIAAPFDRAAALSGWGEFLSLGVPSAAQLVAEWSSYEVATIIAGIHGLDTLAAHNVLSTSAGLLFMIGLGVSVSGAIRVGKRLGENKPSEARLAYRAVMLCTLVVMLFNAGVTLAARSVWARVFTDDKAVVALVTTWLPLLALYSVFDAGQCICSGTLKGVGRPALAAVSNVVAYCVISLPLCHYLCNGLGWGLPGIWAGFVVGVSTSCVFLSGILQCLDWRREAEVAHTRALQGAGAGGDGH